MREAAVNLVSVGIFAWARLEPEPGRYEFGWLDRLLGLLHEHGLHVDLATATASPPPWLSRRHPESLPVTREGVTLWPGSRQHYCPSSTAYRGAAARLVEQIATRYAEHPALACWHVNNEYGCHVPACYCDRSAEHFRRWLRERHGSLDALNEAWGTAFWSQRYGDWDEIVPPRAAPYVGNPSQELDWHPRAGPSLGPRGKFGQPQLVGHVVEKQHLKRAPERLRAPPCVVEGQVNLTLARLFRAIESSVRFTGFPLAVRQAHGGEQSRTVSVVEEMTERIRRTNAWTKTWIPAAWILSAPCPRARYESNGTKVPFTPPPPCNCRGCNPSSHSSPTGRQAIFPSLGISLGKAAEAE